MKRKRQKIYTRIDNRMSDKDTRLNIIRAQAGDKQACENVIMANMRLVIYIANKIYREGQDKDDMISDGMIGLMKAIATYNPEMGASIGTYAYRCIQNEMYQQGRNNKKHSKCISMDTKATDDMWGDAKTIGETLCDDGEEIDIDILREEECEELYRQVNALGERHKSVICLRYGLGGSTPLTQAQASKKMGLSQSYVSRLEARALEVLRKNMRN